MRLLVIGATGFIGAHLMRTETVRDLQAGGDVRVWDHKSDGDVTDPSNLRHLMSAWQPDAILHLAWVRTGTAGYEVDPSNSLWMQVMGDVAGLCAASGTWLIGLGSCVETLSDPVYATPYRSAKVGARLAVLEALPADQVTWCQPHWVFSPDDGRPRVMSAMLSARARGERFVPNEPNTELDFIHVIDVAAALATVLENRLTGVVEIASGSLHSVAQLLDSTESWLTPDASRTNPIPGPIGRPSRVDLASLLARGWFPRETDRFFAAADGGMIVRSPECLDS